MYMIIIFLFIRVITHRFPPLPWRAAESPRPHRPGTRPCDRAPRLETEETAGKAGSGVENQVGRRRSLIEKGGFSRNSGSWVDPPDDFCLLQWTSVPRVAGEFLGMAMPKKHRRKNGWFQYVSISKQSARTKLSWFCWWIQSTHSLMSLCDGLSEPVLSHCYDE